MTDDKPFREKIAAVMVGHSMTEIAEVLVDALGFVLHEAPPSIRTRIVEEACARVARIAVGR